MEIQGYCIINKNPLSARPGGVDYSSFVDVPLRVIEFNQFGDVIAIAPDGESMAMFDAIDVKTSFRCGVFGDCITPVEMNTFEQMAYVSRCHARKGGYSDLVRRLVIAASLSKGRFDDRILWAKQEPEVAHHQKG